MGKARSKCDRLHRLQRASHHIHDTPVNHDGPWRISDRYRSDQGEIALLSGMCGSTRLKRQGKYSPVGIPVRPDMHVRAHAAPLGCVDPAERALVKSARSV